MRKNAPLAALLTICAISLGVRWLILTKGSVSEYERPEKVLSVYEVSIALSNYYAENGKPKLGPDANRDLTKLLLADNRVQLRHVADGQLLDDWGTPFAVFLCEEPGEFSDTPLTINGQTVRPIPDAYPYLTNQVISAGPDREFRTPDDLYSWQSISWE